MDDHGSAPETKTMSQETDGNAQELIHDWELLFWGFLLFGLARLGWLYLHRPDNNAFNWASPAASCFAKFLDF